MAVRRERLLSCVGAVLLALGPGAPALAAQAQSYDLLVSSRGTNSVKRYDGTTGAYLDDFVAPGAGGLSVTQELLLAPDGSLLVTGRGTAAVQRYDIRTGVALGPFSMGRSLAEPTKMTRVADTLLYVSQWGSSSSSVAVFDARSGAFLREATLPLGQPMQHLLLPNGDLLVAAFNLPTIRRIAPDGSDLGAFTSGVALQGAVNLWWHDSGDLLVADWTAGRVVRFDGTTGAYRGVFIDGLANPEGWAIGPDGRLYLAEWTQHRVRRFDRITGAEVGVFATGGGLQNPNSLLFIPRPPDFAVALEATRLEVPLGGAVSTTLALTPSRVPTYDRAIALTCEGLPAGWTCSFGLQSTIASGALPLVVPVTVQTAAASSGVSLAGGVVLVLLAAVWRTRKRGGRSLVVATVLLLVAGGCGGASGPAAPRDVEATITVVAQGDPHRHVATLQVRGTRP